MKKRKSHKSKSRLPSEKDIKKFIKKLHSPKDRKKIIIASLIILGTFLILLTVIYSEFFWQSIGILSPEKEVRREFFIETCSISQGHTCEVEIFGKNALLTIESMNNNFVSLDLSACEETKIKKHNTFVLKGCQFSSFANRAEGNLTYKNEYSGLEHKESLLSTNFFEITNIQILYSEISGKISSVWNRFLAFLKQQDL